MPELGEITVLLRDWSAGNPAATSHLFELESIRNCGR